MEVRDAATGPRMNDGGARYGRARGVDGEIKVGKIFARGAINVYDPRGRVRARDSRSVGVVWRAAFISGWRRAIGVLVARF